MLMGDYINMAGLGEYMRITGFHCELQPYVLEHGNMGISSIETNYGDSGSNFQKTLDVLEEVPLFVGQIIHALFEGETMEPKGINVLVVEDGVSTFMRCLRKLPCKKIFTNGAGLSSNQLMPTFYPDPATGGLILKPGAFVLADKGILVIENIDEMANLNSSKMWEAMSQKSIKVKDDGVKTLNTRCSVIAFARPSAGRYDEMKSVSENTTLPETMLAGFDIIVVVEGCSFLYVRDLYDDEGEPIDVNEIRRTQRAQL